VGNVESFRAVPSGLIEDENGVSAGTNFSSDLVDVQLHGFAIAEGQHEGGTDAEFGADGAEQIGRLRALVVAGPRSRARPGPAIGQLVLLADPHLVLEPHLYRRSWSERTADFRHTNGEVFLNASIASALCL